MTSSVKCQPNKSWKRIDILLGIPNHGRWKEGRKTQANPLSYEAPPSDPLFSRATVTNLNFSAARYHRSTPASGEPFQEDLPLWNFRHLARNVLRKAGRGRRRSRRLAIAFTRHRLLSFCYQHCSDTSFKYGVLVRVKTL